MDKKFVKKLAIATLVITLIIVIINTPVTRFAQAQSTTKILRIGYFPNINHAQAVIGFGSGEFQKEFGGNIDGAKLVMTLLLLLTSLLLVPAAIETITLAQAKSSSSSSSSHSHSTTTSKTKLHKPGGFVPGTTGGGFAVQPPPGTEPLTTATANNSAAARR